MAYNERLTQRVREALSGITDVKETRMMRGTLFMVDGKMCMSTGDDELMCRIAHDLHETSIEKPGCRSMLMKGKVYKGYVLIKEDVIESKENFDYWVGLALDYNKVVKASPKKKKK